MWRAGQAVRLTKSPNGGKEDAETTIPHRDHRDHRDADRFDAAGRQEDRRPGGRVRESEYKPCSVSSGLYSDSLALPPPLRGAASSRSGISAISVLFAFSASLSDEMFFFVFVCLVVDSRRLRIASEPRAAEKFAAPAARIPGSAPRIAGLEERIAHSTMRIAAQMARIAGSKARRRHPLQSRDVSGMPRSVSDPPRSASDMLRRPIVAPTTFDRPTDQCCRRREHSRRRVVSA